MATIIKKFRAAVFLLAVGINFGLVLFVQASVFENGALILHCTYKFGERDFRMYAEYQKYVSVEYDAYIGIGFSAGLKLGRQGIEIESARVGLLKSDWDTESEVGLRFNAPEDKWYLDGGISDSLNSINGQISLDWKAFSFLPESISKLEISESSFHRPLTKKEENALISPPDRPSNKYAGDDTIGPVIDLGDGVTMQNASTSPKVKTSYTDTEEEIADAVSEMRKLEFAEELPDDYVFAEPTFHERPLTNKLGEPIVYAEDQKDVPVKEERSLKPPPRNTGGETIGPVIDLGDGVTMQKIFTSPKVKTSYDGDEMADSFSDAFTKPITSFIEASDDLHSAINNKPPSISPTDRAKMDKAGQFIGFGLSLMNPVGAAATGFGHAVDVVQDIAHGEGAPDNPSSLSSDLMSMKMAGMGKGVIKQTKTAPPNNGGRKSFLNKGGKESVDHIKGNKGEGWSEKFTFGLPRVKGKLGSPTEAPGLAEASPESISLDELRARLKSRNDKFTSRSTQKMIRDSTIMRKNKDGAVTATTSFSGSGGGRSSYKTQFDPNKQSIRFLYSLRGGDTLISQSDVVRNQFLKLEQSDQFVPGRHERVQIMNRRAQKVMKEYGGKKHSQQLYDAFLRNTDNGRSSWRIATEFGARPTSVTRRGSDVIIETTHDSSIPEDFELPSRDRHFIPDKTTIPPPAYETLPSESINTESSPQKCCNIQ
ncbi:hypothetical protein [Solemya elarraichensis gill symbiont]|uniref:Uncharacterized protein n=1 Tax=Solemya elarraichensis gill symbiont TaxID=1918949 RepID=A0A1T2L0K6_9GAMM|nr:hypothetical protein [Solemya elarraichensis gill symbiont]OOZ38540.1 hypothetical protein BOW52_08365 [Solemya elarraichensis gill symbiont]